MPTQEQIISESELFTEEEKKYVKNMLMENKELFKELAKL